MLNRRGRKSRQLEAIQKKLEANKKKDEGEYGGVTDELVEAEALADAGGGT